MARSGEDRVLVSPGVGSPVGYMPRLFGAPFQWGRPCSFGTRPFASCAQFHLLVKGYDAVELVSIVG